MFDRLGSAARVDERRGCNACCRDGAPWGGADATGLQSRSGPRFNLIAGPYNHRLTLHSDSLFARGPMMLESSTIVDGHHGKDAYQNKLCIFYI